MTSHGVAKIYQRGRRKTRSQQQSRPPRPSTVADNLWRSASQGLDGIGYQRSAQITLWSILEGTALSLLVSEIPDLFTQAAEQVKWYLILYIATSIVVLISTWIQMAWAILIAQWPITVIHTTMIMFLGATLSVACSLV